MGEGKNRVWRWNVNPTWHHCTSMYQESYFAENATDNQERYHHFRGCLYFGIGTVESFINEEIREFLKDAGSDQAKIDKEIEDKNIGSKFKKYLPRITETEINVPDSMREIFDAFRDMRNEVTHPSHEDHSIYQELDEADPDVLVETVTEFLVLIHEGKRESFPYWLLGWNYVGCDGDPTKLTMGNLKNCFLHSLKRFGFDVPAFRVNEADRWTESNMKTLDGFRELKEQFSKLPHEIEPVDPRFPDRPRLTERWWDDELIMRGINQDTGQHTGFPASD